jgi:TPR repeat protein
VKDKTKAIKWYEKAAEQGYEDAQFNLDLLNDNSER